MSDQRDMTDQQILADLLKRVEQSAGPPTQEQTSTEKTEIIVQTDEILEMDDSFDFDGFQVVRREFFAHIKEPSVSFNNCKFSVNNACISKFPETEFVQVMVNRNTKILALRPCDEGARDSYPWCYYSKGRRKPKAITCKLFFAKIVSLMDWNPNYRYKLLGRVIHANGEYLLAFDLTATEVYQKTTTDDGKPKASRTPVFPAGWQDQFGLPFSEHEQSMQINIFDGYAVYAIKDSSPGKAGTKTGESVNAQIAIPETVNSGGPLNE